MSTPTPPAVSPSAVDPSGLSTADVDRLRADTPGCLRTHHFNNAGSALPPQVVVDTMVDHLRREAEIGGYEAHAEAQDRLAATYTSLGRLVGSGPEGIALTTSATDAWLRGFLSIPLGRGDRILVAQAEYASNVLAVLAAARRVGAAVEAVPDDASGVLDVDALRTMLDERVKVVAVSHAPSQNGLLNPVAEIGRAVRELTPAAWYVVDACQSVGQVPLDAAAIGADFLSATGRKFLRGPRGSGFLWSSPRAQTLEPALIDLDSATWTTADSYVVQPGAKRFESWEKSYAAVLGIGAAADYALALGLDVTQRRISWLADRIRLSLAEVPGVVVRDRGTVRTGIVTFSVEGREPVDVVRRIKERGVNVSHSPREYAVRDFDALGVTGLVRVSPHVYTDDSDLEALMHAVRAAVS
ncbi:MAG TPA: aminotransferase class V-fold PLP-dependent enzyme [Candidatus Nanopelagicales bacterium]